MRIQFYTLSVALLFIITLVTACSQKDVSGQEEVQQINTEAQISTSVEHIDSKNAGADSVEPTVAISQADETDVSNSQPSIVKKDEQHQIEDSWFLIGAVTGKSAYKVYVDPESIVNEGELVVSWSKLEFDENQTDEDGLTYKEAQICSSIDCKNRTYSYTDSRFFDGLGRMIESQPTPYESQPIIEGTVSAKIADFVCEHDMNESRK